MRHNAVRSRNLAAVSIWAWSIEKEEKPWKNREKGKCLLKLQLTDVESCKNYWTRAASRPHLPCLQTTVFSSFSLHYQPLTLSHQEFQGKSVSQRSGHLPCWLCRGQGDSQLAAHPDDSHSPLRGNWVPLQDANGRKSDNPWLFMWDFVEEAMKVGQRWGMNSSKEKQLL